MNINDISINKKIAIWLFICAYMVTIMILIGGLTRLTNSGLSIVEWSPVTGILFPLNNHDWLIEFEKYKQFPEYNLINQNMTLREFKFIYLLEYTHRLFGRLIGFVFLLPLLYFSFTKKINKFLSLKLIAIFLLGGVQGFIGWYMVKSGLVSKGSVSQYRLTLHLISAFLIYSLILWNALIFWYNKSYNKILNHPIKKYIYLLYGVTFLQLIFGGLAAGTDAGLIYNDFPFMGKGLIPDEVMNLTPKYLNFFENPATIQLIHKVLAISLFILITLIYRQVSKSSLSKDVKKSIIRVTFVLIFQVILGILTLIYQVPVSIAIAHQLGAIMLTSTLIYLNFCLLYE